MIRGSLSLIYNKLETIQILCHKPVTGQVLFLATRYDKPALSFLKLNKLYESDGTYIYASFDIPQKSQAHVNTLFCWLQWMVMEIIVHLITMREDHQASNS